MAVTEAIEKKQCNLLFRRNKGRYFRTEDPKAEVDALLAAYKGKMKQLMDQNI
jgi:hypothetical protein